MLGTAGEDGSFQPLSLCSGFARGLDIWKNYAIVGLSKPRRIHAFDCLPLGEQLAKHGEEPICGIQVFDTGTGRQAHALSFESGIDEMYDVAVLPAANRASISGVTPQEVSANVWFGAAGAETDAAWIDHNVIRDGQRRG
jgi:uncharacterized protein (TIGR03032 family)